MIQNNMGTFWLADFSNTMRIFTVIVVTEMMVVVYGLSFLSLDMAFLNQLAVLSLLAQLIAISLIIVLSYLRLWLNHFKVVLGLFILLLISVILTSLYTRFLAWVDQVLAFDLIADADLFNIKISSATCMTLLALLRYFYVQDQWAWQLNAHAKAEIKALQSRIKPHFLYNSLNSIASLIAIDGQAAEKAVLNLSGLFRKAFAKKRSLAPLWQELEWIEEYVAIEKLRFSDRLNYLTQVEETLLGNEIPVLSIQPLIENAILHGIEPSNQTGTVNLIIKQQGQKIHIEVTNPYHENYLSDGSGGAIHNIRKRLALHYGDKASLSQQVNGSIYQTVLELPL